MGDISGKIVVDLCAAPGGKTAQLAAQDAQVIALDRSAKRMERFVENMKRLDFENNVQTVIGDGALWQPSEPVDAVLLDAPCSATGTLRRHPDVMHSKSNHDVERLGVIQERLLHNAATMLKSGGMLLYCTCSLQKSEGEDQVEKFLQAHLEFSRRAIQSSEIGELSELITPNGDLRIFPYHLKDQGGMDGFFATRLVKGCLLYTSPSPRDS